MSDWKWGFTQAAWDYMWETERRWADIASRTLVDDPIDAEGVAGTGLTTTMEEVIDDLVALRVVCIDIGAFSCYVRQKLIWRLMDAAMPVWQREKDARVWGGTFMSVVKAGHKERDPITPHSSIAHPGLPPGIDPLDDERVLTRCREHCRRKPQQQLIDALIDYAGNQWPDPPNRTLFLARRLRTTTGAVHNRLTRLRQLVAKVFPYLAKPKATVAPRVFVPLPPPRLVRWPVPRADRSGADAAWLRHRKHRRPA